ncbi:hypothetical protein [Phyllobacterium endophyticum]|uniref:hypothetical protein n=1 Tax=Phyllobacterium endophyticum TaxID=1149773 RepID=UPI00185733FF|nr:hypothetical protein [Phyllobacterium endophyticum]MBB3236711.1 hypothetical protein [Phyllobacterium endophyticum]
MTVMFQSHGGTEKSEGAPGAPDLSLSRAAPPADGDIAVDEQADFGYLVPPLDAPKTTFLRVARRSANWMNSEA